MTLTQTERARLSEFARIMLPGGSGMAGADDLRLWNDPVDRVLAVEPALIEPMRRILATLGCVETLNDIETVARTDPEGFKALATVLANAYFMHEKVRAEIGYPGQEARDSSLGLSEADIALIDKVRSAFVTWRRSC
ncbi:MAG: hypothetical protein JJU24_11855 [Natronohydrobacter sp.]|nr:hypothetical protein [Paracoccaceae bacterium]MCC5966819.1 hypothetical protein [Natronohydrobacter sp.]